MNQHFLSPFCVVFRKNFTLFCVFFLFFQLFYCQNAKTQVSFGNLADEKSEEKEKSKTKKVESSKKTDILTPILSAPESKKYRYGISFEARPGGECTNLSGAVPVPAEYPEQKVRIVEEDFPNDLRAGYRDLKEGGCCVLNFRMRVLKAGQKAELSALFEVTRFCQAPPENTESLNIPKRIDKSLRRYLKESPFIEVNDRRLDRLAKDIVADTDGAWNKVDAVFRFVRENVKYKDAFKEKQIRGALAALETGEGDCEDMTALFIALLRNLNIPARTVRVPEHCWAEFYLENESGSGGWFGAQVAGNEPLGTITDLRPILQKGDAFNFPDQGETVRYVKEIFSGEVAKNGPDPKFQFIQETVGR